MRKELAEKERDHSRGSAVVPFWVGSDRGRGSLRCGAVQDGVQLLQLPAGALQQLHRLCRETAALCGA